MNRRKTNTITATTRISADERKVAQKTKDAELKDESIRKSLVIDDYAESLNMQKLERENTDIVKIDVNRRRDQECQDY